MRAVLLLLAAAFETDLTVEGPTDDPEELEPALLDEYATDGDSAIARGLQTFIGNATNATPPPVEPESSIPLLPLVLVGLGGAGVAGFALTKGTDAGPAGFEYAADSGLLEDPEYDYDYDEEYDEEDYEE
jgi:hypothetical protein